MRTHSIIHTTSFVLALAAGTCSASAATVAYWNFDQGTAGVPFSTMPAQDLSGNNYTMYGFNEVYGPSYSATTASGSGLSSRNASQDGYTLDAGINSWSPTSWTIELTLKLDSVAGWKTIIGRDGSTGLSGDLESAFYFQKSGANGAFRLNFSTVGGQRYILDSDFTPVAGQWYGFAGVSDGTTLTMYADKFDGAGYQAVGSLSLNAANNNALRTTGNWTFGRGWYNGGFVDSITGNLDNIRFSDTALAPGQLLAVPEPGAATLLSLGALALVARRLRGSRSAGTRG